MRWSSALGSPRTRPRWRVGSGAGLLPIDEMNRARIARFVRLASGLKPSLESVREGGMRYAGRVL